MKSLLLHLRRKSLPYVYHDWWVIEDGMALMPAFPLDLTNQPTLACEYTGALKIPLIIVSSAPMWKGATEVTWDLGREMRPATAA